MKKLTSLFITIALLSSVFFTSCKPDPEVDTENQKVNRWITSIMKEAYFWTAEVPSSSWNSESDESPTSYFKSLLYDNEDRWSHITNDYDALLAELNGTPLTMGYFPIFGTFWGTNDVFIIVGYVYPNSSAANAGLERGDIILKINGIQLNTNNYYDLTFGNSAIVTLGQYDGSAIYETNTTLSMEATTLDINPAIKEKVFEENGKTIGYVAITEFTDYDNFKAGVSSSLNNLIAAGVEDLIVDLRYNLGGSLESAVWLSSALAPSSVVNNSSLLTTLKFNDILQPIFANDNSTKYYLESNNYNLNLNKVYFLTSYYSASASELVISGLEPYMDVVTVGDTTHGKWVGSSLFPHPDDDVDHNYGMLPIMFQYTNSVGENVKGGIIPNYAMKDLVVGAVPLGDETDPMIASALNLITGITKSGVKSSHDQMQTKRLIAPQQKKKMNLIQY